MTRQTSIDCYYQIKAEGLLSKRRFEVFTAIHQCAPCTASEALKNIKTSSLGIGSRFTELRELGVIKEIGVKKCTITGRNVIEWDLTDNLPEKTVNKKETRPKNLKKCIDFIIRDMNTKGLMFIDNNYLISLRKIDNTGI